MACTFQFVDFISSLLLKEFMQAFWSGMNDRSSGCLDRKSGSTLKELNKGPLRER